MNDWFGIKGVRRSLGRSAAEARAGSPCALCLVPALSFFSPVSQKTTSSTHQVNTALHEVSIRVLKKSDHQLNGKGVHGPPPVINTKKKENQTEMNLSIATFCLICIISSGSAKLPPFEDTENRDFIGQPQIDYHHGAKSNRTFQNDDFEIQHEKNEKFHSKRHQSYYDRSNGYDTAEAGPARKEGTRMLRTYGRGKAQVTRQGQTVNVPNEHGRNGNGFEGLENEVKPRRGACRECPSDQTVIASKGNAFAILPEPCSSNPKMWNHHSGPRPGNKIQGSNTIRGYIGPKKKYCQYEYQVMVRKCEQLYPKNDETIECSADNVWGSICNVTCAHDKEPLGPIELECKEDLTWSNPLPKCKSKTDCMTPKAKAKSKMSCQTADMREVDGDIIPNGSTCKFRQNGKDMSLNCKDGKWRIIRKNKAPPPAKTKQNPKKPEKNDPCNPNPCQNGGTCLRPESNKGPPICKCRPQTRGIHCEMRECYYNICENEGLCFFLNEERMCYCTSEYSGETCQNYTPQ